jgi:hypothetical protein
MLKAVGYSITAKFQFFFEADQIAYRHSGTPEFKYLPKLPELTTVE